MCENPFYNEPGYEMKSGQKDPRNDAYNEMLLHETIRVAFIDIILTKPSDLPEELHQKVSLCLRMKI